MNADRISTLDGFRAACILMVVLFHYYSKWTPPLHASNLYPYGAMLSDNVLFRFGYLGVHFFFVISGFVISMTLARCNNLLDFLVKRFARLWPTMLLCSVITFAFLRLMPVKIFTPSFSDFIPSLTFIDGGVFARLKHFQNLDWIDGAYWSLFVEVRFYFWAAILFFLSRSKFLFSFLCFTNLGFIIGIVGASLVSSPLGKELIALAFIPDSLPWFAAGVGFYYLFKQRDNALAQIIIIESFIMLLALAFIQKKIFEIPFYFLVFSLFYIFIYRSNWLKPFNWKPISAIGAASYSLYLLHQNVGVTLIAYLSKVAGATGAAAVAISVGVMGMMILVSLIVYKAWEVPAKQVVLKIFLPAQTPRTKKSNLKSKEEVGVTAVD
jgi:peptidoglycan/LPS O-acetylase OafA/YrhL